jgi:hypothetical protein
VSYYTSEQIPVIGSRHETRTPAQLGFLPALLALVPALASAIPSIANMFGGKKKGGGGPPPPPTPIVRAPVRAPEIETEEKKKSAPGWLLPAGIAAGGLLLLGVGKTVGRKAKNPRRKNRYRPRRNRGGRR